MRLIAELMERDIAVTSDTERVRPDESEVMRLRCDNGKILAHTAWKRNYRLKEGLLETIDWLKSHRSYYKPEIYNV